MSGTLTSTDALAAAGTAAGAATGAGAAAAGAAAGAAACGAATGALAAAAPVDSAIQNLALHIFLSAVEQGLRAACPADSPPARIGAVAFIHRFGALLNPHVHFHCVVVDGMFEVNTEADVSVRFHETPALNAEQLADIQGNVRRRFLRAHSQWLLPIRKSLWGEGVITDSSGSWRGGVCLSPTAVLANDCIGLMCLVGSSR